MAPVSSSCFPCIVALCLDGIQKGIQPRVAGSNAMITIDFTRIEVDYVQSVCALLR